MKIAILEQAAAYYAGTRIPADMDHPVSVGETIEIYGLGLGVTDAVLLGVRLDGGCHPHQSVSRPGP